MPRITNTRWQACVILNDNMVLTEKTGDEKGHEARRNTPAHRSVATREFILEPRIWLQEGVAMRMLST